MKPAQPHASVDAGEVAKFAALADSWWDSSGPYRPLHRLNPVRLAFIRDRLCAHLGRDTRSLKPLKGLRIADIGCGGGLLTEPLARMGADVVGIDAAEENVAAAAAHAEETGVAIDYRATTAEALVAEGASFDAVVSMEVVEHVADRDSFLADCVALTRPGGGLFLATLNRTVKSYAMAIVGAEYLLRWLPRGTHDWKRFVRPSELAAALRNAGADVKTLAGVGYNPMTDTWGLEKGVDVNYMAFAVRREI
ncbi:MAG: bifunctional 2-polyprenyl-6-hydroxyphenol methylase/3-demethylubiquinol 3-O-methyltransferase UbiG [Alphaproteobacteria bacterium]